MSMKVVVKRRRFPAAKKKRLKHLAAELREQKRNEVEMEEARKYSPYYNVALHILSVCDLYYHDGLDIDTVMSLINQELHEWVYALKYDDDVRRKGGNDGWLEDANPERLPQQNYEIAMIWTRHEMRPHDTLAANMMYLLDNTVGMWYDGYYGEKLAMNLLMDYATVLVSGWSGRKRHLEYRRGR